MSAVKATSQVIRLPYLVLSEQIIFLPSFIQGSATSTMSDNVPAITDASTLFDNSNADVILRLYDNVDFRVFEVILFRTDRDIQRYVHTAASARGNECG